MWSKWDCAVWTCSGLLVIIMGGCAHGPAWTRLSDKDAQTLEQKAQSVSPELGKEYSLTAEKAAVDLARSNVFIPVGVRLHDGILLLDCAVRTDKSTKDTRPEQEQIHDLAEFANEISSNPATRVRVESADGRVLDVIPIYWAREILVGGRQVLRAPLASVRSLESSDDASIQLVTAFIAMEHPPRIGDEIRIRMIGADETMATKGRDSLRNVTLDPRTSLVIVQKNS